MVIKIFQKIIKKNHRMKSENKRSYLFHNSEKDKF